jgi:thiol-disulfide isomerase/thioredoxin
MSLRRRDVLVSVAVAATALGAGLVAPRLLELTRGADPSLRAASFVDLNGRTRTLSEWTGKILVANFWATWCAPCLEEIPLLMAARKSHGANGVEIVGIAIDTVAKVVEFAAKLSIDYTVLLASADSIELMRSLGNRSGGLPFTVFLDRAGAPVRTKLGVLSQPELNTILTALGRK